MAAKENVKIMKIIIMKMKIMAWRNSYEN